MANFKTLDDIGDVTGKGHSSLADYYTAKGEAPGRWWGAGLAGMHLVDQVGRDDGAADGKKP